MTYLYLDESGDLGMGPEGSKYFILACVTISDENVHTQFRRIPKKIRQRTLKKKPKDTPELKFSNSSMLIREQFLKRMATLPIQVYVLVIRKEHVPHKLKEELSVLYNYLIKTLLGETFANIVPNKKLYVFLDRTMSKPQRDVFEQDVKVEFVDFFRYLPDVEIVHKDSQQDPGIQMTDFVCGAFGYKYNTRKLGADASHYVHIIKERIALEQTDVFKEKETNPAYLSRAQS